MNREETIKIMTVLKTAYPNYYREMKRNDADNTINLWAEMFKDDPAEIVVAAVKAHIATDEKGFPPHIGAIKNAIVKLTKPPELEMTEMEAWALVRRAIHGSYMEEWSRKFWNGEDDRRVSAQYEYDRLPPLLQRVVGGPDQLAEWNKVDDDTINTVIQSNFMRSFRDRGAKEREYMALPTDVRKTMERISGGMQADALQEGIRRIGVYGQG